MRSYLVDFENVKSKGLLGIDKLEEDDHVIVFYSENSDTISFDMHCLVMQSKANIQYMKVKVGGKNALDFQLSTLLGYMVAKELNTHIFVISNDKGFDRLHDFWQNTFVDSPVCVVFRTPNILSAINFANYNSRKIGAAEQNISEVQTEAAAAESENTAPVVNETAEAAVPADTTVASNLNDDTSSAADTAAAETAVKAEQKSAAEKKPVRRGRPRKSTKTTTTAAKSTENPAEQAAEAKEEAAEKKPAKRGRPRKSTSTAAAQSGQRTATRRTRKTASKEAANQQGASSTEDKARETVTAQ